MKTDFGDEQVSPSVTKIYQALETRIRTGHYKEGHWLPTERELVEEFGVSRTIVRKAVDLLDETELIVRSPRCRTIVRNPTTAAPRHASSKRQSLGLWIWPNPHDPAAYAIGSGIYQTLNHENYRLVVGNAYGDDWTAVLKSEAQFLEHTVRDQDIAGVILWYLGGERNIPALQSLRAANTPLVFIDRRPPPSFDADFVGVENEYAAEQVVKHLTGLGHRRIAHVTNLDMVSSVAERMSGYRRALAAANLPFDPALILTETAPHQPHESTSDVFDHLSHSLMKIPDRPTAVFAVNDAVAMHLIASFRSQGVRVPEDISVAGFDGVEQWRPGTPFLTTAKQCFERIGSRAVSLLLHRIESGPSAAYQHILLEAPLSIHHSTCERSRMSQTEKYVGEEGEKTPI